MKPNIIEILDNISKEYPEKLAIIDKNRAITFGELESELKKTAQYFLSKGIVKGDNVLVFVPMSIDLYRVSLALNYIGATAIFIEDWITFKQLKWCCQKSKPKAIVTTSKGLLFCRFTKSLKQLDLKINHNKHSSTEQIKEPVINEPEAIAIISFTTGSSGVPKMLSRSFDFLTQQFYTLSKVKNSSSSDIELITIPVFLFLNLAIGVTSVIADFNILKPDKIDFKKIESQITKHNVNGICSSPSFVIKLAQSITESGIKSSIRKVITGGAPVFPDDATVLCNTFSEADILILYGASEVEPISTIEGFILSEKAEDIEKGLNVGIIHPETNVKIKPLNKSTTDNSELISNIIGEILVSGSNVLLNNLENFTNSKNNNKDDKLWHFTGDTGYINSSNELILTGPLLAILRHKDRYWSPFIFEGITKSIEGIEKTTLQKIDNKLVAVVQINKSFNRSVIMEKLNALNFPLDKIVFIPQMPKDPRHNGKIDYIKLKKIIHKI
ncbi:MAG: AMP-binding protein [Bacteroidales bacterium]|nr:AMP-binding protein [Bacteroidales bacterium]